MTNRLVSRERERNGVAIPPGSHGGAFFQYLDPMKFDIRGSVLCMLWSLEQFMSPEKIGNFDRGRDSVMSSIYRHN